MIYTGTEKDLRIRKTYILFNGMKDTLRVDSEGKTEERCIDWEGLSISSLTVWVKR